LKDAKIRCVMATGDNIQTAISIAKKCGLVKNEVTIVETAKDIQGDIKPDV
jgi:cation-transporting ATPase 13A3/4/5